MLKLLVSCQDSKPIFILKYYFCTKFVFKPSKYTRTATVQNSDTGISDANSESDFKKQDNDDSFLDPAIAVADIDTFLSKRGSK